MLAIFCRSALRPSGTRNSIPTDGGPPGRLANLAEVQSAAGGDISTLIEIRPCDYKQERSQEINLHWRVVRANMSGSQLLGIRP